jgi:uncharacterized membrane protein YjdF
MLSPALKRLVPVGSFVLLYLLIAIGFAAVAQNWEFVFYIAIVMLLGALVTAVDRRVSFRQGILWGLAIWGLLHMLGGLLRLPEGLPFNGDKNVLYSLWLIPGYLKFDHIVHAFGFFVATWVCWEALRSGIDRRTPTAGLLMLCALAGMGLGALNEIIEFIAVLLIPDTNVGGYENTGWDLVSNFVGAVLAAFTIKWIDGKSTVV